MAGETVDGLLRAVRSALSAADFDDPAQEARILVSGLLDLTGAALLSRGADAVAPDRAAAVHAALARRLAREPAHRILGMRAFYGLTLTLSPATLEPRPDTETLVDAMLAPVRACVARSGQCRILDLGTGTGAICLALLSEVPAAIGTGVDLSAEALATASANAERNGLSDRFRTVQSDWFTQIDGLFDIIVSNPPYIRSGIMAHLEPEVRDHDPALALDGGLSGLDAYTIIARDCGRYLDAGGAVGVEIGFDQKADVTALFVARGFHRVAALCDLGGRDRVLVFRRHDE